MSETKSESEEKKLQAYLYNGGWICFALGIVISIGISLYQVWELVPLPTIFIIILFFISGILFLIRKIKLLSIHKKYFQTLLSEIKSSNTLDIISKAENYITINEIIFLDTTLKKLIKKRDHYESLEYESHYTHQDMADEYQSLFQNTRIFVRSILRILSFSRYVSYTTKDIVSSIVIKQGKITSTLVLALSFYITFEIYNEGAIFSTNIQTAFIPYARSLSIIFVLAALAWAVSAFTKIYDNSRKVENPDIRFDDSKQEKAIKELKLLQRQMLTLTYNDVKDIKVSARTNLIVGITVNIAVVIFLLILVISSNDNYSKDSDSLWESFLIQHTPKLSVALVAELLSFYFLRLYRNALLEIRSRQKMLSEINMRIGIIRIATMVENKGILKEAFQNSYKDTTTTILKQGESTPEIEKLKNKGEDIISKLTESISNLVSNSKTSSDE